jgi:serine/threonine protein kinase/tetratricopeptide (TPR) repeat protein
MTELSLGRYQITEQIGAGGMGVVYRARDQRLDRDVAVKILPPGSLTDQSSRSRFRKEALALSRLTHPNIAVVHDFDTVDSTDFLVMELVPGMTLEEKLLAGPIVEDEALKLVNQLLEGLVAAHEQGVIHCDIKPSNLRITPDGRVKVLDFGLAKFLKHTDATSVTMSITQDHGVAGTLAYMSPEQLRGIPPDERTDTYAVGCVLYEMTTGQRPFPESNTALMIDSILNKSAVRPTSIKPTISPGLEYVILKSLERDPACRYQSAKEMLADLQRVATSTFPALAAKRRPSTFAIRRTIWQALAFVVVLGFLAFAVSYLSLRRAAVDSIAILPLTNMSGSSETEYLSDGITDALINSISQLPNLKVIAGSSVIRYRGREIDPQTLGRELQVRAVLTGKYAERGSNLIISVELSDTRDNHHIWGEQYNRNLADIAAVQEEISHQIADMLRLKLTNKQRQQIAKKYTDNPEAYQLYLKGRHYQLKDTPEDLTKSRQYYEQAIDADPSYALAYAGLSECYAFMAYSGELPPKEAWPKIEATALRAAQLDPNLAGVRESLAAVSFLYKWDWVNTETEIKRSLTLDPNHAEAHGLYSIYLRTMHRFDEALREAERADQLDPLSTNQKFLIALLHYYARHYDAAAEQYRQLTRTDPDLPGPHLGLYNIYSRTGKESDAIRELQQGLALQGANDLAAALLSKYTSSGFQVAQNFAIREQIRILTEAGKQDYISPISLATNYAVLDERDKAFEWLEKAFEERAPGLLDLDLDPDYDNLRTDKRFYDLKRRINLPQ